MPVEGLDKINLTLDKFFHEFPNVIEDAMDYELRQVRDYGKEEYVWDRSAKGFNDRTGNLRNSWDYAVMKDGQNIVGYVHAGHGLDYADVVEFRNAGRHAYLYPSCMDKAADVRDGLAETAKKFISHL